MAVEPETIKSVYAERFAADLERNRAEQQQVSDQIVVLQARLEQLMTDEKWLFEVQGTVPVAMTPQPADTDTSAMTAAVPHGITTAPVEAEEAAVPQPRQENISKAAAEKPEPDKRMAKTALAENVITMHSATKTMASKTTAEAPLRELVETILGNHADEPLKVSEVRTELEQTYQRETSTQVVRNALESLAKKGSIEKGSQRGSVMYTKPGSAGSV